MIMILFLSTRTDVHGCNIETLSLLHQRKTMATQLACIIIEKITVCTWKNDNKPNSTFLVQLLAQKEYGVLLSLNPDICVKGARAIAKFLILGARILKILKFIYQSVFFYYLGTCVFTFKLWLIVQFERRLGQINVAVIVMQYEPTTISHTLVEQRVVKMAEVAVEPKFNRLDFRRGFEI
ncbi:hypothetical protein C0J52_02122 [Blattella germanica]|nr:hypothetical protein C0J52_02122 [Blattella germanica]